MARVSKTPAQGQDTNTEWIEDSILREKITVWKGKGYSLDDVILTLQTRDYILDGKQVSLKKLAHQWNAKIVEL